MSDLFCPKARVFLFAGNFGSGKTEIAINYALQLRKQNPDVTIMDLDIIKPYFRCRAATELMRSNGIQVVIPSGEYRYADLPIVLPEIKGRIAQNPGYTILDIGGEDVGARVLSYLSEAFEGLHDFEFFIVVNRNRPFTSDWLGVEKVLKAIERTAKLRFTGLISNNHLMQETDLDTVLAGYELAKEISQRTSLPIFCVAVPEELHDIAKAHISSPILPIHRYLLPPHLVKARWSGI